MRARDPNLPKLKSLLALATAGLLAASLTLAPRPASANTAGYVGARSTHSYTVFLRAGQAEDINAEGDGDIDLEVRGPEYRLVVASNYHSGVRLRGPRDGELHDYGGEQRIPRRLLRSLSSLPVARTRPSEESGDPI
jgi:hypothetical protein